MTTRILTATQSMLRVHSANLRQPFGPTPERAVPEIRPAALDQASRRNAHEIVPRTLKQEQIGEIRHLYARARAGASWGLR